MAPAISMSNTCGGFSKMVGKNVCKGSKVTRLQQGPPENQLLAEEASLLK